MSVLGVKIMLFLIKYGNWSKKYTYTLIINSIGAYLKRLIAVSSVMPKALVKSEETSKKNEVLEKIAFLKI
jgi:hypothetical protein